MVFGIFFKETKEKKFLDGIASIFGLETEDIFDGMRNMFDLETDVYLGGMLSMIGLEPSGKL